MNIPEEDLFHATCYILADEDDVCPRCDSAFEVVESSLEYRSDSVLPCTVVDFCCPRCDAPVFTLPAHTL